MVLFFLMFIFLAQLIPPQDVPESWGEREDFLAKIREERARMRQTQQNNGRFYKFAFFALLGASIANEYHLLDGIWRWFY